MTKCYGLFIAVLILIAVPATAHAQTPVSGDITTTEWTKAESPYRVADTVWVPAGDTLTIDPGVDVLFDANVPFIVEGGLQAYGTATDSVRFLPGLASEWGLIQLEKGASCCSLTYARISGGGIISFTGLSMTHTFLVDNPEYAVTTYSILFLRNCQILRNGGSCRGGGPPYSGILMYDCLIADNDMPIQTTSYVCFLDMTRCTVTGNRGVSTGGIDNESSVTVRNSIIWGNTSPQIRELWFTTRSSIYWAARCFNSCVQGAADYQNPHMPDWDQYNISSDPLFFDPDNGDFRLRTSSPCIGTGEGGVDMGAIPYDASVSVVTTKPIQTTISTPFPNPFNPVTTIRFTLAESGPVSLQVYNPLGQLVRDLSANMTVGQHSIAWNGRDDRGRLLGSGVYLVKLQAGSVVTVQRMTLVK